MLTNIIIRNFKRFEDIEVPIGTAGNGVVFFGPNNCGKSSALQALILWYYGLKKWTEKRISSEKRPSRQGYGVSIGRDALVPLPLVHIDLLWRNRSVRKGANKNILIEITVEGIDGGRAWRCGLEYSYGGPDLLYCRPLRTGNEGEPPMEVPTDAQNVRIALLAPMSGLAAVEPLIQSGRIDVLMGEGRTAEVLRNLCYQLYQPNNGDAGRDGAERWGTLVRHIEKLFRVQLLNPMYMSERGEIRMEYIEQDKNQDKNQDKKRPLDLQSAGRGMQQTMLLLAFLYTHPNSVLLMDEPDAHLEILRQRQIFDLLIEIAEQNGSQIIAASHSELLLNETVTKGNAVAFIGQKPHIIAKDRKAETLRAITDIGWEYYNMAEQRGWLLYLEGSTDLKILRAFASRLEHPAQELLDDPPVKYLETNVPDRMRSHFFALKEAYPALRGILLLDNFQKKLKQGPALREMMWRQREIENYLCNREALIAYSTSGLGDDLFGAAEEGKRRDGMQQQIARLENARSALGQSPPFGADIKASDDFLIPLFKNFADALELPADIRTGYFARKTEFYRIVECMAVADIDSEVVEKLDAICEVAESATPHR